MAPDSMYTVTTFEGNGCSADKEVVMGRTAWIWLGICSLSLSLSLSL